MKIYKTVLVEKEVGVDISPEDYFMCLMAEGSERDFLNSLNSIYQFFSAMKVEAIEMLNDSQKKVVYDFMVDATDRFKI